MTEQALTAGTTTSRIRYMLNDVALYGLASVLPPLMGMIAVPLLTHQLTQVEYGVFELVLSYVAVASVIAAAGQDSAVARFYYEAQDGDYRRALVNRSFWTLLVTSAAVALAMALALLAFRNKVRSEHALLTLAALAVPATVLFNYTRNLLKWTFLRQEYVYASVGYAALVLCGYGAFVLLLALGPAGAMAAQCLAGIGIAAFAARRLRTVGLGRWQGFADGALLRYGASYVLLGTITQGVRVLDKTFLASENGLAAAAVYAVGFKIATLLLLVESTFNLAWGPIALAIHKEKGSADTYNVAIAVLSWLICGVFASVSLFSEAIVHLLAPAGYAQAATVATIVGFAFVLQSLAGVAAIGVELAKKPWLLLVSWSLGLLVTVGILLAAGRPLAVTTTATAVAAGLVMEGIARTVAAYRVHALRLDLLPPLFPLVMAALLVALHRGFGTQAQPLVAVLLLTAFAATGALTLRRLWHRAAANHPT